MKKLTHWMCRSCKEIKKLGEEIARADAGSICKACQTGTSATTTDAATSAAQQQVTVLRKGFVRRNGTDNRSRDE
jgi:hypothetical protein